MPETKSFKTEAELMYYLNGYRASSPPLLSTTTTTTTMTQSAGVKMATTAAATLVDVNGRLAASPSSCLDQQLTCRSATNPLARAAQYATPNGTPEPAFCIYYFCRFFFSGGK